MASNYRVAKALALTTGQSGSCNTSGSANQRVWGVLRGASGAGTILLEGSGSIAIADLVVGEPFPCYPVAVTCSGGTVYILS